ncbi:MAG: hypothetical protein E4H16_00185, partial [Candidatus Atribacteria bacterium]
MSERFLAFLTRLLIGFIFLVPGTQLFGQDEHQETGDSSHEAVEAHPGEAVEEKFNATEYILEHISDSHEWHLITKKD